MIGPWIILILVNLVTVATFARCFAGPGELVVLLPVCLLAHGLARLARTAARRDRLSGMAAWILAVVLVAWAPIAALDWHSLTWGLPLGTTQHLLASQFHSAWAIFSNRVAPVVENRGLVLAAAWAAGAMGLAAEALDADVALPAVVALVPAFDVVVFTGTLGTSTGRAPELAALAALAVAYLAAAARQAKGEQVVTARVEGSVAAVAGRRVGGLAQSAAMNGSRSPVGGRSADPAGTSKGRWRSRRRLAAPGLVAIAALCAGVIGPFLPGAKSAPLLAWHGGLTGSGHGKHGQALNDPNGPITISNLVQVGQQLVNNPDVLLFTEYGSEPTREILDTLDVFNGNQWLPGGPLSSLEHAGGTVGTFAHRLSIVQLQRFPAPLDVTQETTSITQVITVAKLGGDVVPVPGRLVAADNLSHVTISASTGAALVPSDLSSGQTFLVKADLNPGPAAARGRLQPGPSGAPAVDTSLPLPVPVSITSLADQWTRGATSPIDKALLIQAHLTSGQYRYALPRHVPSGAVNSPGSGYSELEAFLYKTRTGFCQQFASAFAVMARIEGLPTRVVVGVLPGNRLGRRYAWRVTGTDVHAWPQVFFKGTGWVDFEPTPGSPTPVVAPTLATTPTNPLTSKGATTGTFAHNLAKAPPTGARPIKFAPGHPGGAVPHSAAGVGVLDVILALLAGAALWIVAVPAWRLARLRRADRDPGEGVVAQWRASVRLLAAAGFHRRRAETYDEYARRVRLSGLLPASAEAALGRLVASTNRAMFGKAPPSAEELKLAASDSSAVRRSVRRSLPWWQKLLVEIDPRDLVRFS